MSARVYGGVPALTHRRFAPLPSRAWAAVSSPFVAFGALP